MFKKGRTIGLRIWAVYCVLAGWLLWIAATALPAVVHYPPDAGYRTVAKGGECLVASLNPILWLLFPRILPLTLANLVMLISPFRLRAVLNGKPHPRTTVAMGVAAVATLWAPTLFEVQIGFYLWSGGSFLVAIGFNLIFFMRADNIGSPRET